MKNYKKESGITLIALIIIILAVIILSGVSISIISGDNGILNQAMDAKNITEKNEVKEEVIEKWYQFEKENIDKNYSKEQKVNLFQQKYNSEGLTATLKNGKTMEVQYKGQTVKINI